MTLTGWIVLGVIAWVLLSLLVGLLLGRVIRLREQQRPSVVQQDEPVRNDHWDPASRTWV